MPVRDRRDRRRPFVFTDGKASATALPDKCARQPIVSKPFKPEDLERALQTLLG